MALQSRETPESSNIKHIDYSEDTQELIVTFNNNTRYAYADVPVDVAIPLFDVHVSPGTYFARGIKKAGYKYTKLPPLIPYDEPDEADDSPV